MIFRKIAALGILGIAAVGVAGTSGAADFCVADSGGLTASFDIADNNGQSDTIRLVTGTYIGNFVYDANAAEVGDLVIEGGYAPGCGSRDANASNTVLDGNLSGRTLLVSGADNSEFAIDAVTIRAGTAQLGGAGLDVDRMTRAVVSNSVFTANLTASGFDGSGGLNIDRTVSVEIRNSRFFGNTGGKGGGLSVSDAVEALIDANVVTGNMAEQGGGGMELDTAGSLTLTNNTIAGNESGEDGAGLSIKIFVDGTAGQLTLTNNTVTANTALQDGGGLDLKMIDDATSADIYNNIVYGNSAGLLGRDMHIDNDDEQNGIASPVALFNNNFDQSALGFFAPIPVAIDPSNLNNVDPMFVNAGSNDYHLTGGSAMVDAGDNAAPGMPLQDGDGLARIVGTAVDLGAFEQAFVDVDGDGISDANDNCTETANPDQTDTDADGFGNACDGDLNNNGFVGFDDLAIFGNLFGTSGESIADFDNSGFVNFVDLEIFGSLFGSPPGE